MFEAAPNWLRESFSMLASPSNPKTRQQINRSAGVEHSQARTCTSHLIPRLGLVLLYVSSNCCDVFGKEINGSLSDRPVLVQNLVDVQVRFRLTHHLHVEE